MENLISLTCPYCGGTLTRSATAQMLACPYCGVEHFVPGLPEAEDTRPQLHAAICIGLPEGAAVTLIERGTRLPAEANVTLSTTRDDQSRLDLILVLGEHPLTKDNLPLGTFAVEPLTPAPRGVAALDVHLNIDEHQHLTVTATEVAAGRTEVLGAIDLSGLVAPPPQAR